MFRQQGRSDRVVPLHRCPLVHCFAGADAFLAMQNLLDEWVSLNRPSTQAMRLRLIPKTMPEPIIELGKLYERRDHYLHVWLET